MVTNAGVRTTYFLKAALREYLPFSTFISTHYLRNVLPKSLNDVPREVLDRVDYYNKQSKKFKKPPQFPIGDMSLSETSRNGKLYYIDFMRYAHGFGPNFKVNIEYGDVTAIPSCPSIVKSRPIKGTNENSILLPLNRLRHFHFPTDKTIWDQKYPYAVWRGVLNNQKPREAAVQLYGDHAQHNIGQIHKVEGFAPPKQWLSISDQLKYRYVLSLEGNDVATNLKWIMASNSVVLAPEMQFETWFMEGRLQPYVHYIPIRSDLRDLDAMIDYCEKNPKKIQKIIRNAQSWTKQFQNSKQETLIAYLVLQKYAELSGGIRDTLSPVKLYSNLMGERDALNI